MSRRVAAIDCGTNSVRLLIAEQAEPHFTELDRDLILTRLGQGVDATGRFDPDALTRTLDAVSDFAARIKRADADGVRFVATSAARDASNRDAFFSGVRERLGVDAEIISGDEEARLSFTGALSAARDVSWPVLVMDIGGGSTELVLGRPTQPSGDGPGVVEILAAKSLDIGSVRIRERFLHSDPPSPDQVREASDYIDSLLDGSGVPIETAGEWIGVGGTATSLGAINLNLDAYDRARVHGSTMTRDEVQGMASRLLRTPVADVLKIPTMQPKRADVICAGALIAARVGVRCPVDLGISEADILDGIVLDLLSRP